MLDFRGSPYRLPTGGGVKLWIDAQLPRAMAEWVRTDLKVEAATLDEIGLRDAPDAEIVQAIRQAGNVIVSKDDDFVDLITRLGPPPQVLWVTCGNVTNRELRKLCATALAEAVRLLAAGEPIVELRERRGE